jgi:L-histidine N-alpha-methyltransferase
MTAPMYRNRAPHFNPQADYPLASEVLPGLHATHKTLPPKLFYDDAGARLFEQICETPEYYITRSELEILNLHAAEIAALAGDHVALIEFGSGAGVKVRLLLDALSQPAAYVPVDISGEQLDSVAAELRDVYPALPVLPVLADYTNPLPLPTLPSAKRKVAFFPGSTIGNFHPTEAAAFLRRVRRTVGQGGGLILGVDRIKSIPVLEAAYNDGAGITAAFNLNLLTRLNRELGADFDLSLFRHHAFYNAADGRIEMHLQSVEPQVIRIAEEPIVFDADETIWTESSYKYDEARLERLASMAGFRINQLWTDHRNRFWVAYLTVNA